MDEEIKNLKLEIEVLKKRIAHLEGIENRRKIVKIIKIVIIVVMIVAIGIFAYQWYGKIMDYYNQINNYLNNPLQGFLN